MKGIVINMAIFLFLDKISKRKVRFPLNVKR